MAKRQSAPRLKVSVKEGARDLATGQVAFRMISVEASGEAGISAAVGLVGAVMSVLDRPKSKEIGK